MKKFVLSGFIASMLCLMTAFLLPVTSLAADNGREGSLTLMFLEEEQPITGAKFHMYLAAEQTNGGNYVLSDEFAKYPVSLKQLDSKGLNTLANTLAAYAARDSIAALQEQTTGEFGGVKFTGLKQKNLYLITGDAVIKGNTIYTPKPFIISVPTANTDGESLYDIVTELKYDSRDSRGTLEREALKVWKDDESKKYRPEKITVQLLRNGKVFEEVDLSADNNWRYTWSKLDAAYDWKLTEKNVPNAYNVSIEQQNITFTVTNTYDPAKIPNVDKKTKDSKLPQTGQIWWPVPVFFIAGIALFFAGIALSKRSEDKNA